MQNVLFGYAIDPQLERKEAVRLVRLALSVDDSDPVALAAAAIVSACMVDDYESAIEMADRAVALNPNLFGAWQSRGWVYESAGRPEEAIWSFERAMRLNPVDPMLHTAFVGMGFALTELGRFEEAIVAGKKALRQNASFRQLTAVSRPLFPMSDEMLRRARRRRACLSLTPPSQYRR